MAAAGPGNKADSSTGGTQPGGLDVGQCRCLPYNAIGVYCYRAVEGGAGGVGYASGHYGDSAAERIEGAGLAGEVLPWRDVLHEGPVPAGVSDAELGAARARFLADRVWEERVALTEKGREVLGNGEDRIRLNGIDRWLGGAHLVARPGGEGVWRWDGSDKELKRPV